MEERFKKETGRINPWYRISILKEKQRKKIDGKIYYENLSIDEEKMLLKLYKEWDRYNEDYRDWRLEIIYKEEEYEKFLNELHGMNREKDEYLYPRCRGYESQCWMMCPYWEQKCRLKDNY